MKRSIVVAAAVLVSFAGGSLVEHLAHAFLDHPRDAVTAWVGTRTITHQQLMDRITRYYSDGELRNMVDEQLIDLSASENNLVISDPELSRAKEEFHMQNDDAVRRRLTVYHLVYRDISDETLKMHLAKSPYPLKLDQRIEAGEVQFHSHDEALRFIDTLTDKKVDDALKEFGTEMKRSWINSGDEEFAELVRLQDGRGTMVMNGEGHAVYVVLQRQEGRALEWPGDKSLIFENYMSLNYNLELTKLLNRLHQKHPVVFEAEPKPLLGDAPVGSTTAVHHH